MKLNLVPVSASRGGGSKVAWVIALLILAASIYAALHMKSEGEAMVTQAKDDVAKYQDPSNKVITLASSADTMMGRSGGDLLNLRLAQAMNAHNPIYPQFYDELFQYIPRYFRLTSLRATPDDGNTCTVTMQGTVGSIQQYADLMILLMRIRGAQAVTRSGYQLVSAYVPPLSAQDQVGRLIEPGKEPLPDDPIQRLDIKIAGAKATNYVGTGGFGSPGTPMERGAAPGETLVTVVVVVTKNLMTPNPGQTLAGAGSAFQAAAGGGS